MLIPIYTFSSLELEKLVIVPLRSPQAEKSCRQVSSRTGNFQFDCVGVQLSDLLFEKFSFSLHQDVEAKVSLRTSETVCLRQSVFGIVFLEISLNNDFRY
jgi:hypothetical protein